MHSWIRSSFVVLGVFTTLVVAGGAARGDIVYQSAAIENNYVPFGEDGTPGRPVPGDQLGNTITLTGTSRSLTSIVVHVALNNAAGAPAPANDTYRLDLYLNDGPIDAASGLGQPGTLLACATANVSMPPLDANLVFDFSSSGLVLPNTFTVVISSTHPTDTFFQAEGVSGPFSSRTGPSVGSGVNTIWYTSASAGWETNSTWAIADGATTNYFIMTVNASPAP